MLKKIISVICAVSFALSVSVGAAYFTDLQDGSYDWAKETINSLADKGVIRGYSDGTYGPAKSVTRQEAFTLFARAIGVNDSDNAYVVEFNQNEYKDVADKYNTYAKAELCLMLERKVLNESEVGTYLSGENKDKPMLRHEAAYLAAKILNIRKSFDENASYELDFTDADDIPYASRSAVAYVKDLGIISGTEDGSFLPNGNVTRAQVAIMLEKVIDKLQIGYGHGTVTNVFENENAIEIDNIKYDFDSEVLFAVNGKESSISNVKTGDEVTTVNTSMGLWFVDIIRESEIVFDTVRGKVLSADDSQITFTDGRKYNMSAFAVCSENSEKKDVSEMNFDNPVTIRIANGFVRSVEGTGTVCEYEKAQIISITTIPSKKIKFEDEYGEIHEFDVKDDAEITFNGYEEMSLEKLMPKSVMYVRSDNAVIDKIGVYSVFDTETIAVNRILIDKTDSEILFNDVNIKVYDSTKFVDEDGNEKTIYDLRLSDCVKLEFEKGKLSVVTNTKYVAPTSFSGVVLSVDAENKMMTIETDGEVMRMKVSPAVVVIRYKDAAKLTLNSVKEGDDIVVAGEYGENSEFVCNSIIL